MLHLGRERGDIGASSCTLYKNKTLMGPSPLLFWSIVGVGEPGISLEHFVELGKALMLARFGKKCGKWVLYVYFGQYGRQGII